MSRARELAGFATATNPIQDLNVGVVTAISFSGDGSSLTGIDATSIKDGDGTVRAQANTSGVVVTGILTATSLEGDGSALTGLPAGLGTAVAATGDGANVYYTNQVLDVGSNLSIDVPATAVVAYTQYPEVAIASGIDLTIADGDDFVADILGIGTTGAPQLLAGGGGRVRADNFVAKDGYNAPTFANGINVSTAATAATFHGDGSALTGMANTSDVSTSGLNVIGIGTFGGDVSIADKIVHTGDTDTAIRFPAADTVTVETGGSERVRVDSSGSLLFNQAQSKILVNTSDASDSSLLNINGGGDASQNRGAGLALYGNENSGNEGKLWLLAGNSGSANGVIAMNTAGSERLRIGSSGELGIAGANYGTSGQVLTSGGSGSTIAWADASGGAWEVISTEVLDGTASDWTSNGWSNTYQRIKLVYNNIYCANTGFKWKARIFKDSTSGNAGTEKTASSYRGSNQRNFEYGTAPTIYNYGVVDDYFHWNGNNEYSDTYSGELEFDMQSSLETYTRTTANGFFMSTAYRWDHGFWYDADPTEYLTGIKIYWYAALSSAAKTPTGRMTVLGMKYS